MIDIPPVEELRTIRSRLSDENGGDVARYAAMLVQVSRSLPGVYVKHPVLLQVGPPLGSRHEDGHEKRSA